MSKFKHKQFKNSNFFKHVHQHPSWTQFNRFFSTHPQEFVSFCLMLIGVIAALFFKQWAGIFIGVSLGLAFSKEIVIYLVKLRFFYLQHGPFKAVLILGLFVYSFMLMPLLMIACAATCLVKLFSRRLF